ncbi:tRNA (adenosine(37)-N6)-dimethylallyltransferase MiaA [Halomonas sp. M5N1S17]|uniref:tRNA (adenosine(37)-N6)-dimethylallyltransferase MiaA n=1 Tax=Halomonas alkalisoli TaxID=2907158 RepID=UPI001F011504|nr:tRNA (adenosine(37)-N6)-dimethylallyltransferase MiaA [Halomonas alkalisoli]MCE9662624.1 tRNA (adenosine(37)-N6)-dimethylallyltransferase MiaA [Halomonas alkalisoli]
MPDTRPPAILLMGPTAAGKTDLAMTLHERLGCDLVSMDSAMVYRGMDIGSAKPSSQELARAPHRLIDIRDPSEPYSAADFRDDALREMRQITAAGRVPLLVGGTMMYAKRLLEGVANLPPADPAIRAELLREVERDGLTALHEALSRIDPESARRIHPNDPQRLMRAMEVYRASNMTLTELWRRQRPETFPWKVLSIGVTPLERRILHERIAERFDAMLEAGLIEEVVALRARGDLHAELPSMKSVGYRQVWDYLDGKLDGEGDIEQLRQRTIVATRQLAKRQLTWLRGWPGLHWIDTQGNDALSEILKLVREFGS